MWCAGWGKCAVVGACNEGHRGWIPWGCVSRGSPPPATRLPWVQVQGVVELGSPPSPDSDKAAAVLKWAQQLQSLQQAVVAKLAV